MNHARTLHAIIARGNQPPRRALRIALSIGLGAAAFTLGPGPSVSAAGAQEPDRSRQVAPPPADTYENLAVADLVRRARLARNAAAQGLEGYAARLRHRFYVGLTAVGFRRERGVFEQERIGRVRWSADGSQLVEWEGMRASVPIAGLDTRDSEGSVLGVDEGGFRARGSTEMGEDLAEELLNEREIPGFDLDPFADRLLLDSTEAVHPLADDGYLHYRYFAGDTLAIDLPGDQRDIVLHEVRVEPRRSDYNLLAASLWFDSHSYALVRAGYRPARPFNLALDTTEEDVEMPGWLARRIEMEFNYVTIEYSLHEMEYWLPRRYAMRGEARAVGLVHFPVTFEWSLSQYSVNDGQSAAPPPDPLELGWKMETRRLANDSGPNRPVADEPDSLAGPTRTVVADEPDTLADPTRTVVADEPDSLAGPTHTVVIPPLQELLDHPELRHERVGREVPLSFSRFEISSLTDELNRLVPFHRRFAPRYRWGYGQGLPRYNRVEGLSLGVGVELPLSLHWSTALSARIGTGELTPYATATLSREDLAGTWTFEGYREFRSMSDTHRPFSLASSLDGLVLADERGEFYRATGLSVGYRARGRSSWSLGAFGERHRAVERNTEFSLRGLVDETSTLPVRPADAGDMVGLRASLEWFDGVDPNQLIVSGRIHGEAAVGDLEYARLHAAASLSHPLPYRLSGAFEVAGGGSLGGLPIQRNYFLGGAHLRGALTNEFAGSAFWRVRAEVATRFAAARLGLFTDVGTAGSNAVELRDPVVSAGIGLSLLDGVFRLDLARGLRRVERWKLHFYLDGLL